MPDPNSDFFSQIKQSHTPEQTEEQRLLGLQETIIKKIFAVAGYKPSNWWTLQQDCHNATNLAKLNFAWFHEAYPTFPVQMGVARVGWVFKLTMRDMFDNFLKSGFFKAYTEFISEQGLDDTQQRAALVFYDIRRPMVLHNYPREGEMVDEPAEHTQGTRIVHQFGRVTYVVEPLAKLLSAIGGDWLPT